jgi:hypothetical protein
MTFSNIMVHLEPEPSNDACLELLSNAPTVSMPNSSASLLPLGHMMETRHITRAHRSNYVSISPSDWPRPKTVFDLYRPRERLNGGRQQRGQLSTFPAKRALLILS